MTKANAPGSPAGLPPEGSPFGVAVTADGQWAFVSLGTTLGVLRLSAGRPADLVQWISLPASALGEALTHDGRYLLLAGGNGAVVVSVSAAEQGSSQAVLGELSAPGVSGAASAIEVAVSADEAPVGLALAEHGSLVVVADSNRFGASGESASLAVVDVPDALAGRPALAGYLPAGQFPRDMATSPNGSTVLVANYDSGQIETVNLAALP